MVMLLISLPNTRLNSLLFPDSLFQIVVCFLSSQFQPLIRSEFCILKFFKSFQVYAIQTKVFTGKSLILSFFILRVDLKDLHILSWRHFSSLKLIRVCVCVKKRKFPLYRQLTINIYVEFDSTVFTVFQLIQQNSHFSANCGYLFPFKSKVSSLLVNSMFKDSHLLHLDMLCVAILNVVHVRVIVAIGYYTFSFI